MPILEKNLTDEQILEGIFIFMEKKTNTFKKSTDRNHSVGHSDCD